MNPRMQPPKQKEQVTGNIVVLAIGCAKCPVNEEYRTSGRNDAESAADAVGKVLECSGCHSKWVLKRVQVRGNILDDDPVKEEWRVAPLFVPVLSTFGLDRLTIVDVPIAMIDEDKDDEQ